MILHISDLSAECYAVRLLAALLDVTPELRRLDIYPGHDQESAEFLALNPLGTVPVLEDSGLVLRDWQAILAYIAMSDTTGLWWPRGDATLFEWLGFARTLALSAGVARLHYAMGLVTDIEHCRLSAHSQLNELERHLWFAERAGFDWLLPAHHPTAADVAVFVHVILCEEGGIERLDYPVSRRWTDRVRCLPGFVAMGGVFSPLRPDTL